MGKLFLHGRGNKSTKVHPRAKLTVTCPAGLTVYAKSVQSSLTFGIVADDTGKAVFDRLTEGVWDITVSGVDNPPTERIVIDDLDRDVSFPYMTIYVTYPRYSTCTCSNGDAVLTAPDRSGSCSFDIYELGDWTVSATNGAESGTEVVSVTSFAENRRVDLVYDLWLIDYTKQRQVVDPVEFWGNDDENVEMTVNNDGSVSFKFLTANTGLVTSNTALNVTRYQYMYITSVLDRVGTAMVTLLHPASTATMSGYWTVDKDTTQASIKCNMIEQRGDRLMRIGSDGTANTTMTIKSLSLREPINTSAINVTYPIGSTCTCYKGDTIFTAPDMSDSYTFTVDEFGEWTIIVTDGTETSMETILVESFGERYDVKLSLTTSTINVTCPPNSTCTCTNGNIVLTASDTSGSYTFTVLGTGNWIISCTDGYYTVSEVVTIGERGTVLYIDLIDAFIENSIRLLITNRSELTYAYLPDDLSVIGSHAFDDCVNLALTSIPESVTSIGDSAFYDCTNLALTSLPKGVTSIGISAFYKCTNLKTLTFKGTPNSITNNAFRYCTNLTTINVPWSEGAVANAPWGATKATINYNYKGREGYVIF